jgi:hypothetical protein
MSYPHVTSLHSLHFAPSPALDNSRKQAKSLHCNVPYLLLTPDHNHSLLQVVEPSATMERSRSVNPDKLEKVINTLTNLPDLKVLQAMLLARLSNEEVADLSLCCFIWHSLPVKTVKGLKAYMSGPLLPPPPQPDRSEWLRNRAIDEAAICIEEGSHAPGIGACERAIAVMSSPLPPLPLALARPRGWPPSLVSALTAAVKKRKSWDRSYYLKKKFCVYIRNPIFVNRKH